MLILKIEYDQYYATGDFIGTFSLSPAEGIIDFPELTVKELPKIIDQYMIRVFPNYKNSYQAGQYATVFRVKYKMDEEDNRGLHANLLVTPNNFGSLFPQ